MLHHKSTHRVYRDIENDLQSLSIADRDDDVSDIELYQILAEYDEMQRSLDKNSIKLSDD